MLAQAVEATRVADLAFTRDEELHPSLICRICEKFVQTLQICRLFYHWAIPMMQGIIQNLVTKVLRAHPYYIFASRTIDLQLAPEPIFQHLWPMNTQFEDLSSPLMYRYPSAEGQIRYYGRDFMVQDLVAYTSYFGVPSSPSTLVLEPISNPTFSLSNLRDT